MDMCVRVTYRGMARMIDDNLNHPFGGVRFVYSLTPNEDATFALVISFPGPAPAKT